MTSRELVRASLDGKATPRVPAGPLVVHAAAAMAGVSIERYTLDPLTMVDCICRYYERFRPDAVWLSADTWPDFRNWAGKSVFFVVVRPASPSGCKGRVRKVRVGET